MNRGIWRTSVGYHRGGMVPKAAEFYGKLFGYPLARADELDPELVLDAVERMSYGQLAALAERLGVPRPRHEFLYLPASEGGGYLEPLFKPGG